MLIMPLHKPWSRQNIPWVTLLLVLINVAVYLGYQRKDDSLVESAVHYYVHSGLGALEADAHARYLQQTANAKLRAARQAKLDSVPKPQRIVYLAQLTMHDVAFEHALRSGSLFKDDAHLREWRALRAPYQTRLSKIFTLRHLQRSSEWSPARMLTATFLHGSFDHLLGNMLFLLALGTLLEGAIGSGWFLLLYVLGGFGASLASLWWRWGEPGGGLGASGAIAALMGAFCVVWGRRRVRFFYWFFVVFNYARGPAILLLPLWLGWELYSLASRRRRSRLRGACRGTGERCLVGRLAGGVSADPAGIHGGGRRSCGGRSLGACAAPSGPDGKRRGRTCAGGVGERAAA